MHAERCRDVQRATSGIANATRQRDDAIMREHVAIERVQHRIVDVGLEHALAQVVKHRRRGRATEPAKRLLVDRMLIKYFHSPGCEDCQRFAIRDSAGERTLYQFPAGEEVERPRCDADGRRVVFSRSRLHGYQQQAELWLVATSSGAPRQLTSDGAQNNYPVFAPGRDSVVFTSQRDGKSHLWELGLEGGRLQQITFDEGPDDQFDITADGTELVFNIDSSSIPLFAFHAGASTRITSALQFLSSPVITPDGKEVVAVDNEHEVHHLVEIATDGTRTTNLGQGDLPSVTVDGRSVVFIRGGVVLSQLLVGGQPRQLAKIDGVITHIVAAQDGIHLTASQRALRVPLEGGTGEVEAPAPWCLVAPAPVTGWRAVVDCSGDAKVGIFAPGASLDRAPAFRVDGELIGWQSDGLAVFVLDKAAKHRVKRVTVSTGEATVLLERRWLRGGAAVSPDGQTVYAPVLTGEVTRHLITNLGDRPRI